MRRQVRRSRAPRAHWLLLLAILLVVAALLTANALVSGAAGEGHGQTAAARTPGPAVLLRGGPVVNTAHLDRPGLRPRARTFALTFDDGPTAYTARILDLLATYRAHATFFVTGAQIVQHPDLIRRMVREGDEIGIHTFTHPHLGAVAGWRERLELDETQQALAAVTGRTTSLLRLPYSSTASAITAEDTAALRRAGNYRAVFATEDTKDWSRPGVASILRVARASMSPRAGTILMMHDGGGNRAQTVQAVRRLLPELRARGYDVTTVTRAVGVGSPWQAAGPAERARGWVALGLVRAGGWLAATLYVLMIAVTALSVLRLLVLVVFARRHARRVARPDPSYRPTVSVVVPAYNEAVGIAAAVRSLAASTYPDLEIIVVDDGSTDDTARVVAGLALPGVRLITQPNAGKPEALNTGIRAARGEVLVLVDGDTVFEPGTVGALVGALSDPAVGAVSGNTKVGNRRGLLGRWQHIEYVIGFNLDRRMFDTLHCMPTIPGAVGAFRRDALEEVGLVSSDTLAEDTDLTMAVCRTGRRVVYEPGAIAWTEAPATLGQLWRQRYRWCYGTLQAMWKHKRAVTERGASGVLGRRGLPYLLLFQVLLPTLAPVVDLAALYSLWLSDTRTVALTWVGFLVLQYLAALYAFTLDRESPRVLWALVVQQLVYRQLMYLVVIESLASACYGIRLRWHTNTRTGLDVPAVPAAPAR